MGVKALQRVKALLSVVGESNDMTESDGESGCGVENYSPNTIHRIA